MWRTSQVWKRRKPTSRAGKPKPMRSREARSSSWLRSAWSVSDLTRPCTRLTRRSTWLLRVRFLTRLLERDWLGSMSWLTSRFKWMLWTTLDLSTSCQHSNKVTQWSICKDEAMWLQMHWDSSLQHPKLTSSKSTSKTCHTIEYCH